MKLTFLLINFSGNYDALSVGPIIKHILNKKM